MNNIANNTLANLVNATHDYVLLDIKLHKYFEENYDKKLDYEFTRKIREQQKALENQIYEIQNYLVQVGDGVTEYMYSDKHAYTVISRTAQTITIQRDKAIRTDERGMSDWQNYDYERDTDGNIMVARWSKKRGRWQVRSSTIGLGRHEYYDYSF
jgi:hypothetical protein